MKLVPALGYKPLFKPRPARARGLKLIGSDVHVNNDEPRPARARGLKQIRTLKI